MNKELALRLFVMVVENKSFSKAGARLGIPQSSTSRIISKLEERLGVRLLKRSTRKLMLTEAGQIYFERAVKIVTEIDEADEAVRSIGTAPAGLLRVTAPVSFSHLFIAPALTEFHTRFPDITLGLSLNDNIEDLMGLGYDVAIRIGELPDSNLRAHFLVNSTSVVCASPAYLSVHGTPQEVDDLAHHNCLQFRTNPGRNTWEFHRDGVDHSTVVSGSLYANNGETLLQAALSALGICLLPEWILRDHLDAGRLQPVLPQFKLISTYTPIHAVVGYRKYMPAKQRVFIEFLKDHLATMPWPDI
jgi:DNA-binding transcriptional LysR family regulator